jgi:hypothetical protein
MKLTELSDDRLTPKNWLTLHKRTKSVATFKILLLASRFSASCQKNPKSDENREHILRKSKGILITTTKNAMRYRKNTQYLKVPRLQTEAFKVKLFNLFI